MGYFYVFSLFGILWVPTLIGFHQNSPTILKIGIVKLSLKLENQLTFKNAAAVQDPP